MAFVNRDLSYFGKYFLIPCYASCNFPIDPAFISGYNLFGGEIMIEKIKAAFASHYFEGALLILFGIIMVLFPSRSIHTIGIITGAMLLALGAVLAVSYVMQFRQRHTLELFAGLMCIALGVEFVFRTSSLAPAMHAVLSITLIYSGILLFLQAYSLRNERGPLFIITLVFAAAAVVFAILMLINDDDSPVFLTVKGISMIVEGIASLFVIKALHIKD